MNQRPVTTVIFDHEEKKRLEEFAGVLETIASKLRANQSFTIVHNGQPHEVKPNAIVTVEMKYSTKGTKHSFEIEMEWNEGENTEQFDIV